MIAFSGEPFDWEAKKQHDDAPAPERKVKVDERAEMDQMEDTDTRRDIEESAESAATEGLSENKGFAKEDTLENVADVHR